MLSGKGPAGKLFNKFTGALGVSSDDNRDEDQDEDEGDEL